MGKERNVKKDTKKVPAKSIKDKSFFSNDILIPRLEKISQNNNALHILGLLSDGGVHSHIDHILALIKLAKEQNVQHVFIHVILDGRDTPPKSASAYIKKLENFCKEINKNRKFKHNRYS